MGEVSTIGLDIAKSVFQVHGVDVDGAVVKHGTKNRPWLARLMERRPTKVAAVALANKIARMAWAIMVRGDRYKEPKLLMMMMTA